MLRYSISCKHLCKKIMEGNLKIFTFVLLCFSTGTQVEGLLDKLLNPILDPVLSIVAPSLHAESCVLDTNQVVSVVHSTSGPTECNLCDSIANLTAGVTDLFNSDNNLPIDQVVTLHCVKA